MTKQAGRTLLFSVAALALSACSDQRQEPTPKTVEPEEVRSADDAKSRLLKGIKWDSRPSARATLYSELLKANDTIGERAADTVHHSNQYEWMALIDYEPGAYFRHPVSYAFISYEEPTISMIVGENLPTVNFKDAWQDTRAFLQDTNVFYDQSWIAKARIKTPSEVIEHQPVNWPPRMAADNCKNEKRAYALLIHNINDLNTSPETKQNLESMASALSKNGYNVQEFLVDPATGQRVPYLDLTQANGRGIQQLVNYLNIHVDFNDCCEEILVYLTGETTIEKSGYREEVAFDIPFHYSGPNQDRAPERKLYPEDIATFFDRLKTCHLNFVIDANNAECFSGDLLRIPNTESVLSSCQNHEYTYSSGVESLNQGAFNDPYGLELGETGSEFTSSFVKALLENAAKRDQEDYPESAVNLVKNGFESAKLHDLGYLGGESRPTLTGRTINSRCPCGIDEELASF